MFLRQLGPLTTLIGTHCGPDRCISLAASKHARTRLDTSGHGRIEAENSAHAPPPIGRSKSAKPPADPAIVDNRSTIPPRAVIDSWRRYQRDDPITDARWRSSRCLLYPLPPIPCPRGSPLSPLPPPTPPSNVITQVCVTRKRRGRGGGELHPLPADDDTLGSYCMQMRWTRVGQRIFIFGLSSEFT